MENKVLTQEELEALNIIQDQRSRIMSDLGLLEYSLQEIKLQKQNVIEELKKIKINELSFSSQLEAKYGKIQVNATTGEIIPLG